MAVDVWTGFTLALGTTGLVLKVRKVTWNPPQKAVVDVSHQGSAQAGARQFGGREFVLGRLPDAGTLEFEVLHDPTQNFPVSAAAVFETLTLQPPAQVCSQPFTMSGKLLAPPSFGHGIDDEPIATLSFKITGLVSMPAA